ncbi:15329_t:CDS:2 [Acaulospora colombiana]|uniref:15329_t:CDS:1 n=1 Tax=Acaulospora colombiana TaxID=27376 RepID=A0ACA9MZQ8_9GLOM|nr:15329_t:CDS:2 [Acaulospora colombiana]
MSHPLPAKNGAYIEDFVIETKIDDCLCKAHALRAEKRQIRGELVELVALAKRLAIDSVKEAEQEVVLAARQEAAFHEVVRKHRETLPKTKENEDSSLVVTEHFPLMEQANPPSSSESSSQELTRQTSIVSPEHNVDSDPTRITELHYIEQRPEKEDKMLRELGNLKQIIGSWAHLCATYNQDRKPDHEIPIQGHYVGKPRSRRSLEWTKGGYIIPEKEARMEKIETNTRRQRKSKINYQQFKDTATHIATVEMPQIEAEARESARGDQERMQRSKRQQRERRQRRGVEKLSILVSNALQTGEPPKSQRLRKKHPNPQRK